MRAVANTENSNGTTQKRKSPKRSTGIKESLISITDASIDLGQGLCSGSVSDFTLCVRIRLVPLSKALYHVRFIRTVDRDVNGGPVGRNGLNQ